MIAENIQILQNRIALAVERSGRKPDEVTLIAVSKTIEIDKMLEAMNAGIGIFGENYAQELRDKYLEMDKNIVWHFIGHLQTNKVKYVADAASFIHSLDSVKLADEINRQAALRNRRIKVLLEVKTSDEETKNGLQSVEDVYNLADHCKQLQNIELCGLMTMAPFVDDDVLIRNSFRKLKNLQIEMQNAGYPVQHLSMGMTGDFEAAIEEGATMIRVGTAIFGERQYNR